MNILIVRLSAIGDVIHGLPVLAALKKKYPEAKIGWVVEELSSPLLKNHPMIDKLYIIPKKRWRNKFVKYLKPEIIPFIKNIKKDKWDVSIDMQGLTKSGLISYFCGAKMRIGFGGTESRELNRLFINKSIKPDDSILHVVNRNLSLLKAIDIINPDVDFPIVFDNETEIWADNYLKEINWKNKNFAIINIGAGWITKRLDLKFLCEVSKKIISDYQMNTLFMWGPSENSMLDEIRENLKNYDSGKWQIAPSTNLLQLISLTKRSAVFIAGDTGAVHIAAALNVPVISYFGASDSKRNGPLSLNSIVIQKFELDCVPCWKTSCRFTDNRYLQCLKNITTDEIIKKIPDLCKFRLT